MRAHTHSYKYLLVSAAAAFIALITAPAVMADPPSWHPSANDGAAATAPAQAIDPPTADPGATGDGGAAPQAPAPTSSGPGPEAAVEAPSAPAPSSGGGAEAPSPDASSGTGQSTDPGTPPASASSAIQAVTQVQTLGCTSHCRGSNQSQSAQQINVTIQPAAASQPAGQSAPAAEPADQSASVSQPQSPATSPAATPPAPGAIASQHKTKLVQLQLGCIAHCFGSTTLATDAHGGVGALRQLLASPPPPELPDQSPAAVPQNVVRQSSVQLEDGQGVVGSQSQSASQVNVSARGVGAQLGALWEAAGLPAGDALFALSDAGAELGGDPSPPPPDTPPTNQGGDSAPSPAPADAPPSSPGAGAGASRPSSVDPAINQVEQAIWQLQIGCLVFCTGTNQSQKADQATRTVAVVTGGGSPAVPPPITGSYQLVWQLQVGCLFWCYDSVETQTATMVDDVVSVLSPGSEGSGTPPGGGGDSSGSGGTPTPGGTSEAGTTTPLAPAPANASPGGPVIGSPPAGLITAGPVAIARGQLSRRVPRLPRLVVPALPLFPTTPWVFRGMPASRMPISLSSETGGAPPMAGHAHRELTRRHELGRHHRRTPRSEVPPPELLARPAGTSWGLMALFALVGLLAAALVVSDLRVRRTRRREA